ncbi:signal peptidase I [soil metagenome]
MSSKDPADYSQPIDLDGRVFMRSVDSEQVVLSADVERSSDQEQLPSEYGDAPVLESEPRAGKRGGLFREILETVLIALIIFVAVRSLVLNFRVEGQSMMPNLTNGEMLIVNRNAYESFDLYRLVDWIPGIEHAEAREVTPFSDPQRGDIIVFDPPVSSQKPYIKRIIGLPGETVEVRDGFVYIDGDRLDEPYIEGGITNCNQRDCEPVLVEEGQVFVMGDNRQNSSDSRVFGPVEVDSVQGKAWIVYWPISEFGPVDSADYPDS